MIANKVLPPFYNSRVIFVILVYFIVVNLFIFFSKSQHIFSHLLNSLLLSLFIFLPFSFPTLLFLYLAHLTQFFLSLVLKRNVSTTMLRMKYILFQPLDLTIDSCD